MNNSTFNFPQDLLWQESITAIKTSAKFQKFENFHKSLIDILPQNSIETRKRNAGIVIKRYFPDNTFQSLCPLVWKYYHNEKILEDIMRYQFMQKENLVSHFLVDYLLKIPYDKFTIEIAERFSLDMYNEVKKNLIGKLNTILKELEAMNYIYFDKKQKTYLILKVNTPKATFLILLHYLFSEKPQTISVNNILENPFWKYIRIYSQNTVREILKEANANGILSKYVIADTLEQVTTKYSFLEFIEAKIKL